MSDSTLTWELREGGLVRAARSWVPMAPPIGNPTCPAERYFFELTPEEAATVLDWGAVNLVLTANGGTTGVRVMKAQVDIPMALPGGGGGGTIAAALTTLAEYEFQNGAWVLVSGNVTGPPPPPPPPPEAGPTPSFIGKSGFHAVTGTTGISQQWPTPHVAGNIGLIFAEHLGQAPATPAGWTLALRLDSGATAAGTAGISVFWKRATSSAEANVSITPAAGSDHLLTKMYLVQDALDTGDPFDASATNTTIVPTAGTVVTCTGANTGGPNRRLLFVCAHAIDTGTAQFNSVGGGAPAINVGLYDQQATAQGLGGGWGLWTGEMVAQGAFADGTAVLATASKQANLTLALMPKGVTGGGGGGGTALQDTFRSYCGVSANPQGNWGTSPYPDNVQNQTNGASLLAWIAQARAQGFTAALIPRVCGGNANLKDSGGHFSVSIYISRYMSFIDEINAVAGGMTTLRNAVRDGIVRGFYTLDDIATSGDNSFVGGVTWLQEEAICQFHKTGTCTLVSGIASAPSYGLPWMPLLLRSRPTQFRSLASGAVAGGDPAGYTRVGGVLQSRYLDALWGQWRPARDGAAAGYVTTEVQAALDCACGVMFGINWEWGQGVDNFGCQTFGGSPLSGCASSPTEILSIGNAVMANAYAHGFNEYSYQFAPSGYFADADIQAAFATLTTAARARFAGKLNQRGDITAA